MTSMEKDVRIHELTQQVMRLEKERDRLCDSSKYDDTAFQTFAAYQSFINAGFDEDKAWEVTKMMIGAAMNNQKSTTIMQGYVKK